MKNRDFFGALFAAGILVVTGCCNKSQSPITLFPQEAFETTVDNKAVSLYTLRAGVLTMQVTNYGARVVALWAPDRNGQYEDIVLGYESIDRYINNSGERFLGAVVGPYANRIAKGRFTLDGKDYQLPTNNNGQTLHGGLTGLDRVVWDVVEATDSTLVMHYLHKEGEEGFPGNLDIRMTYSLTANNEFRVDYDATTDRATPVNISHHSFFNLLGEGNGSILGHRMTIPAGRIVPVDSVLIPTGELLDVTNTPFDFRTPHTIGDRIGVAHEQLACGSGYDHCWVIDRKTEQEIELMARVEEPVTGRTMEVWSDQVGIQFYSGNFFDGAANGKYGKPLCYRESLALETQKFPDSPNHSNFPSTILQPDEHYRHVCIYRFDTN